MYTNLDKVGVTALASTLSTLRGVTAMLVLSPSSPIVARVGDVVNVTANVFDVDNANRDLSAATATMVLYTSAGSVAQASASASTSGTTLLTLTKSVDTTSYTPGLYTAVFTVAIGAETLHLNRAVQVSSLLE